MALTQNKIVLPQAIRRASKILTAANATYNGVPNVTKLIDGGANGSILRRLQAVPLATVTATQLQLFVFDGTTYVLANTAYMSPYTMAQTTQDTPTDFGYSDGNTLYLPNGFTLYVGIGVAVGGGIAFHAEVNDF